MHKIILVIAGVLLGMMLSGTWYMRQQAIQYRNNAAPGNAFMGPELAYASALNFRKYEAMRFLTILAIVCVTLLVYIL